MRTSWMDHQNLQKSKKHAYELTDHKIVTGGKIQIRAYEVMDL